MQAPNTVPLAQAKPVISYLPEITVHAVAAVKEVKKSAHDSTTINLSDEARKKYVASEENDHVDPDGSPARKANEEIMPETRHETDTPDSVNRTLEQLQELLKKTQQRLKSAQQQMAIDMAEMKNAADKSRRTAAMEKVQAAQMMMISIQGDVLEIYRQISEILRPQQK